MRESSGINVVLVDQGVPNEWIGYTKPPTVAQPPKQAPQPVPRAPAAPEPANCHPETIIPPEGVVRAGPNLKAKELWRAKGGTEVQFCGRIETDDRGISWHWVTVQLPQEKWEHDGWMSSKILADLSQMNRPAAKESSGAPERPGPPAEDRQRNYDRDLAICKAEAAEMLLQSPRFPCRGIIPCIFERGDREDEKAAVVNGCMARRGWRAFGK